MCAPAPPSRCPAPPAASSVSQTIALVNSSSGLLAYVTDCEVPVSGTRPHSAHRRRVRNTSGSSMSRQTTMVRCIQGALGRMTTSTLTKRLGEMRNPTRSAFASSRITLPPLPIISACTDRLPRRSARSQAAARPRPAIRSPRQIPVAPATSMPAHTAAPPCTTTMIAARLREGESWMRRVRSPLKPGRKPGNRWCRRSRTNWTWQSVPTCHGQRWERSRGHIGDRGSAD